ncbi:pseudouridine synthase [Methylobacterium isbiliense]|jgi:23S rRNA pseudouridine2605 synthase|uniref:Pseudouridine synthase n=1 Tax=Methylobacterium isbiliense TaxID=315478 RepID=A0ABQ4SNY6_9HYPH|nr:pseudouridine synthase [Methylobacterium isbiliense]GJE04153.1 hypothetical protein GMJLKIPL_6114 [Methylobacterium isbiliense]
MSDSNDHTPRVRKGPRGAEDAMAAETPAAAPEPERIAKAIARAGLASRRDAEAMILDGRVTLNGERLTSPAVNVGPQDRITVDGEPLPTRERTRLWIFHKPRGVVTTARDPEGRQTVFDILPEDLPRVVAIGRLDINTEGLLLLTNDGGLAKVIAHPETGWLRRYRVRAYGDVDQAALDRLRKGITIDGMEYGPVEGSLDRQQGDNVWLTLGLREGKNREVKRILEHLGLSVNRLIRLSFGPFQLGDLEVGLVEEVRTKVLKEQLGTNLAEQAGVDFTSPVREPIAPFGSPKAAAKGAAKSAAAAGHPERGSRGGRDPARPQFGKGPAGSGAGKGFGKGFGKPQAGAAPRAGKPDPTAPRRAVWRDPEAEAVHEARERPRVRRRISDPKEARAAAAERPRERVGAIATGERRVLVERLRADPAAEPRPERAPRGERPARDRSERPQRERTEWTERPPRERGERPARAPRPEGGAPERRGPKGGFGKPGGATGGPAGGFAAGRPGGKPGFGKPGFGKPGGGRSGGGKPGGKPDFGRSGPKGGGAGRPGGRGGPKPGGRPGGPPRGGRPSGGR